MYWKEEDLANEERVYRLNIINSIIGVKPVCLVGTSYKGVSNVAIFSSILHMGSEPAAIALVTRPSDVVPRHTLANILKTKVFTLNMVCTSFLEKAHFTSTKLSRQQSEFDACQLEKEYIEGFEAPFVRQSPIKVGMEFVEKLEVRTTQTTLVVGKIKHLFIKSQAIDAQGYVNYEFLKTVGVGGLNRYYRLQHYKDHPYARISTFEQVKKKWNK